MLAKACLYMDLGNSYVNLMTIYVLRHHAVWATSLDINSSISTIISQLYFDTYLVRFIELGYVAHYK